MAMEQVKGLAGLVLCAGAAWGQPVLVDEDFEDNDGGGWLANGIPTIFDTDDGNPGRYMGVPFLDFFGVHLRHEDPSSFGGGDLTAYPSVMLGVDVRVFAIQNFDGIDIDPSNYSMTLQLIDRGDPNDFMDDCSVYFTYAGLPQVSDGWARYTWTITDTSSAALPEGWGGTGAEDPDDYTPILPPGRTFASVLASVDEIHFTTFEPGFFYGFNFWEVGFDNVRIEELGGAACSPADIDANGVVDLADFFLFFGCYDLTEACADVDGETGVDLGDFFAFFAAYDVGC